ncbi:MAG: hypothetical protein ACJ71W_17475 [Terriglobales bacterium]
MGTPVQITVTVDANGAVTGFQQISSSGDAMGAKVVTAAEAASAAIANQSKTTLTGAAAVAVLTAKWEEDQKAIAAATAQLKENATAMAATAVAAKQVQSIVKFSDWAPMVKNSSTAFMGMTSEMMKASVTGRLVESTLGIQSRALNQIASRSALLGPLMAAAFPIGILAGVAPIFVKIGEEIADASSDLGGYTAAVKQAYAETVKASQSALLNPKTIEAGQQNLNQLNAQIGILAKAETLQQSRTDSVAQQVTLEGKIAAFLFNDTLNSAANAELQSKEIELGEKRITLLERVGILNKQITDEIARSQESTDLIGKSGLAKIAQEHKNALADLQREFHVNANDDPSIIGMKNQRAADARVAADNRATAEVMEFHRQEAMETMKLRDQVTENALSGIAKVKQEEADRIKETLAEDAQKMGLSAAEVQRTGEFQAQIAKIHQDTSDKIIAYNAAQDARVREFQDRAVGSALTGDAAILASAQKEKDAVGALYAKKELDDQHYNAIIRLINQETNAKIQAEDQKTFDKTAQQQARTVEMQQRAAEDMKTAQEDAALAVVPEWQRASAQIQIELNRRERAIEDQKLRELAAEHLTQDQILAINQDADAKRYDAIVQADIRIREENKRLTESLGSDLQSVFDDIGSGNIGKRILANMEKMFFQIVAQWLLSLNIMKSAAGSILGSIVFGPGSTGAGVFGGGGGGSSTSILGNILGVGGGISNAAPSGAAFQPGGIFSDPSSFAGGGGLSSAIAGTSAATGGGLPSASNALTTATMADALSNIGGGASTVAGSAGGKAGGLSSLFTGNNLASLGGLGLATVGGAFGGKTGQVGGLLMGLLVSGKLAPVLSSLYGTLGLAGTGSLVGGAVGGLIGFGVGQGHGGLLGSLAGAGSGALTGFLVGGPIGAIVGGIVGLLGGIFGGIFGASKRKKQANSLADNTLLPDIAQISTGFDGFQIDSSSAIQQLEQLRTDSQKQLSALKGQGNDVFNQKVNPAIDAAETHIRGTQSERDRRSAQVFGPPQFDTGGLFMMRGGNAGLAVLHHGEAVINSQGTKKNLNAIAAMNAGKAVGSSFGDVHIHPKSLDRSYVMSKQFRKDLLDAMHQAEQEGAM